MDCIKFTVYGEPVAQGRPRGSIRNGKVHMRDPAKSKYFKQYVALIASQHQPKNIINGPVAMDVKVYRPMAKSVSNSSKKKEKAEKGLLRLTTKPDVDNYVEGVKDALNHLIYKDDSQEVDLKVSKFYSEDPKMEVMIIEVST
ncbi:RusA family crossover junction endodeoxyribonuclease [Bacillus atrophaeus]|uniref:RusA family crossover junction endodeoxyribonuclease n=2 Tax=Bacillus atrophaeus TaxID=1452 RepID=UPI001C638762|nr:RusA family crossover junction endodeoxyribonuclease [Bacillus atrophaeus]MCY8465053.1 RusA family crossover junction endodeoxyribonuclease [Bacillus atrophaeus]MCY8478215.1 RusA family crossover junction endodeoxyribonuclease [Bacillus atrophaeus]MCY8490339.1 RusA family crossover junction endodeoxyribonuclease [Bacillus atrophaeus]MED4805039.1 RusA family crossover junction endodeoxyribonuclease [Bacillus atrophaeus]MED4815912.1 RusA family crossover junction endodeoxyribonuclease [Bacill